LRERKKRKKGAKMILKEAFKSLVEKKCWYKDGNFDRCRGCSVKKKFYNNELTDESMRFYLAACGWQETWAKPKKIK